MFMSDVLKKEECRNEALQELRKLGIKCRPKKPKQQVQTFKSNYKTFKVPLKLLPTETVTLKTGQQIAVPKLVRELCSCILTKVNTEGLFRKEGSKVRQGETKLILNNGGALDKNIHIIDAAALLKTFFRELPEPLIPYTHHEIFLRCALLDLRLKTEALLLACLLLPLEHLNTLTYMLQFFYEVAKHSAKNKMDAYNLAVVVGPAIFPIEDKLSQSSAQMRTSKICEIIQTLIENALNVGILPESIIERLGSNNTNVETKKKKRRSGSLTRMFNGLKKIVGGKSVDDNHALVTPDLLLTPINSHVMKKRRSQNGISQKKKKEVINKLPDTVLLSAPFTPLRTPVSMDLRMKEKRWFARSRSVKNLKQESAMPKSGLNPKTLLERRWSAITPSNSIKRTKKRNSFSATPAQKPTKIEETEPDYIKVSKTEYEAIKNRVSAMERRISIELENVQSQIKTENESNKSEQVDSNLQNVQVVYEQTLETAQLSPTADHLAKRLSRELKIRRSGEQKIIRSPSARKIGSMRRRSREMERSNAKLARHQSWHVAPRNSIPRVSLKRGKPNTVLTGLPMSRGEGDSEVEETNRTRSSSVGEKGVRNVSCNLSGSSCDTWVSAECFFETLKSTNSDLTNTNGRASLAKLRSQNAGMVLAKAKLFDKLSDSDSSGNLRKSIPRAKIGNKIGSSRNMDSRLSYRVRNLKYEERKIGKKSMSPRRRNGQLSHKHKIQIAKQYLNSGLEKSGSDKENIPEHLNNSDKNLVPLKEYNVIQGQKFSSPKYSTPRIPPHIKKPLNVRSPKRLCRTPMGVERCTPLRVLKTPVHSNI